MKKEYMISKKKINNVEKLEINLSIDLCNEKHIDDMVELPLVNLEKSYDIHLELFVITLEIVNLIIANIDNLKIQFNTNAVSKLSNQNMVNKLFKIIQEISNGQLNSFSSNLRPAQINYSLFDQTILQKINHLVINEFSYVFDSLVFSNFLNFMLNHYNFNKFQSIHLEINMTDNDITNYNIISLNNLANLITFINFSSIYISFDWQHIFY